ncbi:hypothetical protein F5Y07DRAFT_409062 [Xylaria sp. FL0933]|nr:hypothetical protein F5Y07DRAFT_409062 [Xylaria sp. FL0933]
MGTDIAIIGSGCRFPGGALSPSRLWGLLRQPRLVASEIPGAEGHYHDHKDYHGHSNVKEAYFLEDKEARSQFDASFFNVSPVEAAALDPQVRLLLETVYEAIENAGLSIQSLQGSDTAVYAGQMVADYELLMYRDSDTLGTYHATGTSRAHMSNRISYFFDWRGPSITIDTACSSSLVALHYAVQQLRSGQSEMAVAIGANLLLDFEVFISGSKLQMLSPDGRSRMWDSQANGYARGEGIAVVVVKTLASAIANGDHIECIIRETAINQDGRTSGITMPSSAAQLQLIRDCYSRAGLDLTNPADRPQYFEAHGTGTQAGDPIEAEAISLAFFSGEQSPDRKGADLLVGSIKTIIGHTEGASGLAGIFKASLALQNAEIPPNLLFRSINPNVGLFSQKLRIPTTLMPWPSLPSAVPRRASVNSFGFGGTNAHAILESYTPGVALKHSDNRKPHLKQNLLPFVFSANSEKSLTAYLKRFTQYLQCLPTGDSLADIAHTLYARRTRFAVVVAFGASTVPELIEKINQKLALATSQSNKTVWFRSAAGRGGQDVGNARPRVLGVFTGQGAQWAQMGLELLSISSALRQTFRELQDALNQLPSPDQPSWSLIEELQRDAANTRINDASICQPLCTAVQIILVKLLRSAGIDFSHVVGHSSGEIAAAWAAGFISAGDAICIAYYRGLYSGLYKSSAGQAGAMLAVGTSADDAQDLLDYPKFRGRACIAAENSPTSVTLSGDKDAIQQLKIVFEDEKKFTRMLNVDTAYHSHHMMMCADTYQRTLATMQMKIHQASSRIHWYSSLNGEVVTQDHLIDSSYWVRNLVQPVRFSPAVLSAYSSAGTFDLVVEIGPHPSLKRAVFDSRGIGHKTQYCGLLRRNTSAFTSVSEALGDAWMHLGNKSVNLRNYQGFISGEVSFRVLKGLPNYAWSHEKQYWHESRHARASRLRPGPVKELLGHLTPDSTKEEMRWRQIMKSTEISWLHGHKLHSTIVFPGAGYIVMALEGANLLAKGEHIRSIHVEDVNILHALLFKNDETEIETLFSLANITKSTSQLIEATWNLHAASAQGPNVLELMAHGRIRVMLGTPFEDTLQPMPQMPSNLQCVNERNFYKSLHDLGYHYSQSFVALNQLKRRLGMATGIISQTEPSRSIFHPAVIDAAFHSLFLTYAAPGDGTLWSLHVPRRIRNVTVNPLLLPKQDGPGCFDFPFVAIRDPGLSRDVTIGDIDIYSNNAGYAMMQIEGLEVVPFSRATAKDDKELFSTVKWSLAEPDMRSIIPDSCDMAPNRVMIISVLERLTVFYSRIIERKIMEIKELGVQGRFGFLFDFASKTFCAAKASQLQHWKPEWETDTFEVLATVCEPYFDQIDVRVLRTAGDCLIDMIREGRNPYAESVEKNDLLQRWHRQGLSSTNCLDYLSGTIEQIAHRYPSMDYLEISGTTSATTEAILGELQSLYSSYVVTNQSPHALNAAQKALGESNEKLFFKILDITTDPSLQGFGDTCYDVIVASLASQKMPDLERILSNIRRLLKPGGFLIVLTPSPRVESYLKIIQAWSEGSWLNTSAHEGLASPVPNPEEWNGLLQSAGYSVIDSMNPDYNQYSGFFIIVSRATNSKSDFLRDPIRHSNAKIPSPAPSIEQLLILCGTFPAHPMLSNYIVDLLSQYCDRIITRRSFSDLQVADITASTTVLSLLDLQTPVLSNLTHETWKALKTLLLRPKLLFWVTSGRRINNPFANMMAGLLRAVKWDQPTIDYLLLDIENPRDFQAQFICEALLRHIAALSWRDELHISVEPEIVRDMRGRVLIPCLRFHRDMNDRYNSSRRTVLKRPREKAHILHIVKQPSTYIVEEEAQLAKGDSHHDAAQFATKYSLLSAICIDQRARMFLGTARDACTGQSIITLSPTNGSVTYYPSHLSTACTVPHGHDTRLLLLVAYCILADLLFSGLFEGDRILVNEPSFECALVFSGIAHEAGVLITFVSSRQPPIQIVGLDWLFISPAVPDRIILSKLSCPRSIFVDFATSSAAKHLGERIRNLLPSGCETHCIDSLLGVESSPPRDDQVEAVAQRLQKAVLRALLVLDSIPLSDLEQQVSAVHLDELSHSNISERSFTVIDWERRDSVPVIVRSIDAQIRFSNKRTYWLVGLTSGLGLSLCEWMVRHGARYFFISSRQPKIESEWLDEMRAIGATIRIAACDVSKREDVNTTYAEICRIMPPVAGVAQGAMVLCDASVQDMSLEQFSSVTGPKVEGSIHLNDIFQEDVLDFFVFFSSVVSVTGNYGQANYAAANAFMTGLAGQRRNRGLAASVIDIGPILGVGLITRSSDDTHLYSRSWMKRGGFIATSEHDLHQIFAEAVLSGRANSSADIEILSGVQRVVSGDEQKPVWESSPLMSHMLQPNDKCGQVISDGNRGSLHLKEQLRAICNKTDVYELIRRYFLQELVSLFQLEAESFTGVETDKIQLDQIGIDSLSASEIRSWFQKAVEVDIPVLRILNGSSVGCLVEMATELVISTRLRSGPEGIKSSLAASPSSGILGHEDRQSSDVGLHQPSGISAGKARGCNAVPTTRSHFPLSFTQADYWGGWHFMEDKTTLNHTGVARMTGTIDSTRLQQAVLSVSKQHECLRTSFVEQDGNPMQVILEDGPLNLECHQIYDEQEVQQNARLLHSHVYKVANGETMRLILLSLSPTIHYIVFGMHSFSLDGISFQVFMNWLLHHYTFPDSPTPDVGQYAHFSERQHRDLAAGKYRNERCFWREEFAVPVPPLPIMTLSTVVHRLAMTSYDDARTSIRIDHETKRFVANVCRRHKCTPFHFYMATFRTLLLRYTVNAEDIAIGMVDANRLDKDMINSIGPFRNILPLRLRATSSTRFEELLATTRSKTYSALENSRLPARIILSDLDIPTNKTHHPLWQCSVDYRQGQREKSSWGSNNLEFISFETLKTPYDISLEIVDDPAGDCIFYFAVHQALYGERDVQKLAASYVRLVKSFASDSAALLSTPDLFEAAEIGKVMKFSRGKFVFFSHLALVDRLQGPLRPLMWPDTVIHQFEEIAKTHPERQALRHGHGESTPYAELLRHSGSIALLLRHLGVSTGSRVAVLQERTPLWIASIIGIMRVGAAYIPLELSMTENRLTSLIRDSRPSVILADNETEKTLDRISLLETPAIINVNRAEQAEECGLIKATKDSTAAILFTSGSTGKPKGIIISHDNVRNWIETFPMLTNVGENEVILGHISSSFDMSLTQIFLALCHGGTLYIVSRQDRLNAQVLTNIMAREGITLTCGTPSEYAVWHNYGRQGLLKCNAWRTALCIGEPLPPTTCYKFSDLGHENLRLFNMYGPAEASFSCSLINLRNEPSLLDRHNIPSLPGGYTQPNYAIYVLDDQLRPVSIGIQGQIYIGGAGVCKGYMDAPELTAASFVSTPDELLTTEYRDRGWNTLHRSGDRGRWRSDGALLVEGRDAGDAQIKVQGIRVDLVEIESFILDAGNGVISEVAVSVNPPGSDILIGHVVFSQLNRDDDDDAIGRTRCLQAIRGSLATSFPAYVKVAAMIPVGRLPKNASGKLDRAGLLQLPDSSGSECANDQAELTETEARLKEIWEMVIPDRSGESRCLIGPMTDFFYARGTSLLLIGVRARIQDIWNINVSHMDMFKESTLGGMSKLIDKVLELEIHDEQSSSVDTAFSTIDWEKETQAADKLIPTFLAVRPQRNSSAVSPTLTVVMTGATGLLGRTLLEAMLNEQNIARVHCIGVRHILHRSDLLSHKKVTWHEGDLTLPRLGLSLQDAQQIFETSDVVIHNGADTSQARTYMSLRQCNVQATKELATMSAKQQLPFHYISTYGVELLLAAARHVREPGGDTSADSLTFRAASVANYSPAILAKLPAQIGYGYVSTKWASECYLENLNKAYPNWPIWIHRPAHIMEMGYDVPSQSNEKALGFYLLENMAYYATKLGVVPVFNSRQRLIDTIHLVAPDVVAQGILDATMMTETENTGAVRFSHYTGDISLTTNDLRAAVKALGLTDVEQIDLSAWQRKAEENGMHPMLVGLLDSI